MPYNPNVPQPTDNLSVSQGNLLSNFQQLNTTFSINHVPLTTASNNGKHTFLQIPSLGANPTLPAGLALGDGTLYTNTISSRSELFYTPDATSNVYQMTRTSVSSFPTFANNTNYSGTINGGWTFLPGGLLLNYGTQLTSGPVTITFARSYTSTPFCIVLTPITDNSSQNTNPITVIQGSLTNTGFQWQIITANSKDKAFYFMAIGS